MMKSSQVPRGQDFAHIAVMREISDFVPYFEVLYRIQALQLVLKRLEAAVPRMQSGLIIIRDSKPAHGGRYIGSQPSSL